MDGWIASAVCRHLDDPDVMFPDAGDRAGREQARRVCRVCPVTAECYREWRRLPHALRPFGVWAGRSGWQWMSVVAAEAVPR